MGRKEDDKEEWKRMLEESKGKLGKEKVNRMRRRNGKSL